MERNVYNFKNEIKTQIGESIKPKKVIIGNDKYKLY